MLKERSTVQRTRGKDGRELKCSWSVSVNHALAEIFSVLNEHFVP